MILGSSQECFYTTLHHPVKPTKCYDASQYICRSGTYSVVMVVNV